MISNENYKRRLELTTKFIRMGESLIKEGKQRKDDCIIQTGGFLTFLGGILLEEKDVYDFADLCQMFSAKKILDGLENTSSMLSDSVRDNGGVDYDKYVNRINDIINDSDDLDDDDIDDTDDSEEI